ncbi:iron-siderophore ABC transporter substrate-binding protein [Microbacterium halophytorum]|nr:iron-siderophore ABC transporter substrate-binding protein [Microbacterium halophytorum]
MSARPWIASVALAGTALLLASCAGGASPAAEEPAAEDCTPSLEAAGPSEEAVTVEHALGTTEIPAGVERVASIGWGNQDVALALGVAPVGADDQTWSMDSSDGLGLYDWTTDGFAALCAPEPVVYSTADGTDFTAIADSQPDLILAAYSGLTQEDYDTLSEIAPVVAYPEVPWFTPWRDTIRLDSEALGQAEAGEELIASLEDQISQATDGGEKFAGKKAAFVYVNPADLSVVSVYGTSDSRTAFLGDLGFEFPETAEQATEDGAFYLDVAAENADMLDDFDVIVAYGDDTTAQALQDDPLWSTVPAVEAGAVAIAGNGDAFSGAVTPTALSIPWMLDDYVGILEEAATSAK